MYAVYDTLTKAIAVDQHGHSKLYSKEKSARRRAQSDNNAVYPKMDRYAVIKVNPQMDIVRGQPNFTRV